MPVTASQLLRPESPAGPEEGSNRKDKSYRRYASNMERVLSVFDSALQEWADYIAFLGRLLKALQSKPADTTDVPHKALVAKRLAQCLDPNLPSGVHQKTLDVYVYIFSILDKDSLSRDLTLYLPGLSPTMSFASLSVKPSLLSLFEKFIIPLKPTILRSALNSIMLALLPGLEEETSEEFERTFALLNRFRAAVGQGLDGHVIPSDVVGDQYFWQSLFLSSITSSSRRQGALAYLTRELPPLGSPLKPPLPTKEPSGTEKKAAAIELPPEVEAVISPEPGLLIRCFATGLYDVQLLIQRGFLELLVTHLPLHSAVLHHRVAPGDLELLVAAAASVVARREMSLNRRLWTWFLGPQTSTDADYNGTSPPMSPNPNDMTTLMTINQNMTQMNYFESYGLDPLIRSVLSMIDDGSASSGKNPSKKARPFRICLSLMDRWEIGSLVIPRVFLPLMESMWRYQGIAPSKDAFSEVLRSANVFFDGIESSLIWAELNQIMIRDTHLEQSEGYSPETRKGPAGKGPDLEPVYSLNTEDRLDLVLFIVTKFTIREEEMLTLHVPLATLLLLISIRSSGNRPENLKAFKVAIQLLDLIPQRVFPPQRPTSSGSERTKQGLPPKSNQHLAVSIQKYYREIRKGSEVAPPIQTQNIRQALLHNACQIAIQGLYSPVEQLEKALNFLDKLVRKSPGLDEQDREALMLALVQASSGKDSLPFPNVAVFVFALELMNNATPFGTWNSDHRVRHILPALLTHLWVYTSPSCPRHSVEAVRCLWRLHAISPDVQLVEGSLATLLFQDNGSNPARKIRIEGARRFVTVWTHSPTSKPDRRASSSRPLRPSDGKQNSIPSEPVVLARPLLLLLDSLAEPNGELYTFVLSWLQSLSGIQKILDLLILRLCATSSLTQQNPAGETPKTIKECLYYLHTILNVIRYSSANTWHSLGDEMDAAALLKGSLSADQKDPALDKESRITYQLFLSEFCLRILEARPQEQDTTRSNMSNLRRTSVALLQQLLLGSPSTALTEMSLEKPLIETLSWSVEQSDIMLQVPLMDLISNVVKKQSTKKDTTSHLHQRNTSPETIRSASQISLNTEKSDKDRLTSEHCSPPPGLLDCLIQGISSTNSHPVLEHWINFLDECLSYYAEDTFQTVMPLVDCFGKTIESVFQGLRATFEGPSYGQPGASEPIFILNALLNGLEKVLARGHDRLVHEEGHPTPLRSPEQVQGFFGNMVSGVFAPEAQKPRPATANNRLTVLLCFKDAVRVSFSMWSWGDLGLGTSSRDTATSASFNYTSIRLRNRTRRILQQLFAAEALECLETLVEFWHRAELAGGMAQSSTVFNLLHALEGSRPKNTIPALFNAIYSRTNPNVLDPVRKSTLTSELSDISLATFLIAYTRTMEDDALDEIWADCMTFLKDVLANPLPHRQTLPLLLEFTAILGEKMDNTNFGEQRKMRKEIGELFIRLLTATFTIKPLAFPQDLPTPATGENAREFMKPRALRKFSDHNDVVAVVASILPNISKILVDTDRIAAATTTISTQILMPTLRWKTFPRNVTLSTLEILKTMSRIPEAMKTWKRDVGEAFNDARFFCSSSLKLFREGWMPVLRQWTLSDKDRMPELLSRLSPPTSAGIMFGVGASSARLEADRKTQLNLRRMALLMLTVDNDAFVINLGGLQEKLADLMTATTTSSPSSITRAEVYMVLRALVLKNTSIHLAPFWPIINTELYDALSSLEPTDSDDTYTVSCVLQAAKLLDTLLIISPDDFQMREWLFVTDTIDAVYRPPDWKPVALADRLAESLDTEAGTPQSATIPFAHVQHGRKPLLAGKNIQDIPKEKLVHQVLRPFFRQLSISSFESIYRMESPDWDACRDDLLIDLFDDSMLV